MCTTRAYITQIHEKKGYDTFLRRKKISKHTQKQTYFQQQQQCTRAKMLDKCVITNMNRTNTHHVKSEIRQIYFCPILYVRRTCEFVYFKSCVVHVHTETGKKREIWCVIK